MKHIATILLAASLLALPAFAAPADTHTAGAPHAHKGASGNAGGAMMADMEATMARIRATQDPEERARLMERHMEEMHAMMAGMHEQMGRMMQQMMDHSAAAREPAAGRHDHREMKGLQ